MNEQGVLRVSGYYTGKVLTKQGQKKDGTPYVRYTLMLKTNMADQYPKNITIFGDCQGFDTLVEGQYIVVGYELSEPKWNDKAKKNIQYKTATFIGMGDPNNPIVQAPVVPVVQPQALQTPITAQGLNTLQNQGSGVTAQIQAFIAAYIGQTATQGIIPSKSHFVGCYVLNNMPDVVKELVQAYEATFKQ